MEIQVIFIFLIIEKVGDRITLIVGLHHIEILALTLLFKLEGSDNRHLIMALHNWTNCFLVFKLFYCKNGLLYFQIMHQNVVLYSFSIFSAVVLSPKVQENSTKGAIFFFHLLVVAATLLCLPGFNEQGHSFKNLVHSPHVFVHKVRVIDLKEPMIFFVLFESPVSGFDVSALQFSFNILFLFGLTLRQFASFRSTFFIHHLRFINKAGACDYWWSKLSLLLATRSPEEGILVYFLA